MQLIPHRFMLKKLMKTSVETFIILCLCLMSAYSQNKTAFPQGPKGYGNVDFANSGAKSAQLDFLEGLALLHNFEYPLATAAFQRAEAADPSFAMAYWGEAMTFNHPLWHENYPEKARAALLKLGASAADRIGKAKTDREKAYMTAVEALYGNGTKEERDFLYESSMAKLHTAYPDDVDGTAFYGLSILGTAHAGRDTAIYMRAASVLEDAWIDHREHPGLLHYLIHCYDDPAHAPLGLRAARLYAKVAPNAGHANHMISHIYVALGRWPEVVDSNIAAINVVNERRKAAGKYPFGCGHPATWLNYAYLQLDQMDKARGAVGQCRTEIETNGAKDDSNRSMDPDRSVIASLANMRLRYLIDMGELPTEMSDWDLPKTAGPGARLDAAFTRVIYAVNRKDRSAAVKAISELDAVGKEIVDLETKNADPDPSYRVRPDVFSLEARAMLAELDNDFASAEKSMRKAVELEEKLPIAFGPPMIDKPTYELLGEFLLRRGRKPEAREAFTKALARTPGRRLAEQGLRTASLQ